MKIFYRLLWITCLLSITTACQTSENRWQENADLTRDANRVDVRGYTDVPRVIDVVLVSEATNVPFFNAAECVHNESMKTYALRHRFRTKPGKVSIEIPTLPHPEASRSCHPRLKEIQIVDLGQTGNDRKVIAKIEDPMGGVILLDFGVTAASH